jgi:hypothetical protein
MFIGRDLNQAAPSFTPELTVPLRRTLMIAPLAALAASWLTGCATGGGAATKQAPSARAVPLSGTNGDMGKYRGTWSSICGREYRLGDSGSAVLSSGINSFDLQTVSGNTVRGTLIVDTYESPDCSGPAKRSNANITLAYTQNLPVISSYAEATRFTGSADKVIATVAGNNGADTSNTFNVGFLENFTKFQLAPVDYFSSTNLVYTKK